MKKQDKKQDVKILAVPPLGDIAKAICAIDKAMKTINQGRLNRKAILTLVKDLSGESKATIDKIIDSIGDLKRAYVKGK